MDCPYIPEISSNDFFRSIKKDLYRRRIPLSGSLELTWRCNLRCAHCYITAAESWSEAGHQHRELAAPEWYRIIDQITDEGCVWLLLTGGEPLLRADFWDIYLYAKRRGMLITLFTNGTLLTEELAEKLRDWPPRHVEITLYGRTQETYERVTRVPGSHARCLRGIEYLLKDDVPVRLKTMVMTLNRHELEAMRDYARGLGVEFRYDPVLNPCVDGSKAPLAYRLSPEEVVDLDIAEPERLAEWRDLYARMQQVPVDSQALFHCGAGLTGFHIDAFGQLGMCMMVRKGIYDLRQGSFRDGWQNHLKSLRFATVEGSFACQTCGLMALCTQCTGWSQLESGEDSVPVQYLCRITHLRAEALERLSKSA
jgi:radical SAM protein with 4Fe4S-binding SPASM domain